jgi:hypothetical protein
MKIKSPAATAAAATAAAATTTTYPPTVGQGLRSGQSCDRKLLAKHMMPARLPKDAQDNLLGTSKARR